MESRETLLILINFCNLVVSYFMLKKSFSLSLFSIMSTNFCWLKTSKTIMAKIAY
jgi:hypothetical protein